MELVLVRISSQEDDTLGALYLNGDLVAFTMEDEYREVKVPGETRIPGGRYLVKLRTWGGFHEKYKAKYPWHHGILEITNVDGFKDVLIHIGNTEEDTAGCILVGDQVMTNVDRNGYVGRSEIAYSRFYPRVANALLTGERVMITIKDVQL